MHRVGKQSPKHLQAAEIPVESRPVATCGEMKQGPEGFLGHTRYNGGLLKHENECFKFRTFTYL
jgi:hypothetical protein